MFPPFEEELAFSELKKLISQLNLGTIALNQISKPSQERNGNGIMLGAMIALDTQNNKKVLLLATAVVMLKDLCLILAMVIGILMVPINSAMTTKTSTVPCNLISLQGFLFNIRLSVFSL